MNNANVSKENSMFRGDPLNSRLNACVGGNGGPYDMADFAKGYFDCASRLVDLAENSELIIDLAVYPICLAFRQSTELWLKGIINEMEIFWKLGNPKPHGHKLVPLFSKLEDQKVKLEEFAIKRENFLYLKEKLNDWNEIDPGGLTFRYPTDREGSALLADWSLINLSTLRSETKKINEILETCFFQISDARGSY